MHLNWLKPENEEQSIWLVRYIKNRYGDLDKTLSTYKNVPKQYVKQFKAIAPIRWADEEVRKARYRKMYDAWTSKKRRNQRKKTGSDLRITLSQKDKKRFVSLSKKRNLTQSELVVFLLDAYGSMQSEMDTMSDELNRKIETREFEINKYKAEVEKLSAELENLKESPESQL
ncbi:hypothetical protein D3N24_15045 [Vibrio vulnificus]|uniref:Uncharacterized protein n=1 Tax=Vibrio vulnificus TaxID=672 RepID=A0AAW4HBA4_VIBVL|nr:MULTISPECIES: hypothetical protein [Vibrio]ELY2118035.1 hypothetical protein [Vibrio parahaemolyticus]EGQ8000426.1 hypothetical protein [Vibrio vulnificus]EGR1868748.1 hypothetical protein [Vibrio vulnificus]EIV1853543.1 hypothetical protein [Vibrio vulnificus]EJP4175121.1 hypothetical protein [Vibrio vulnificus]